MKRNYFAIYINGVFRESFNFLDQAEKSLKEKWFGYTEVNIVEEFYY
jgi:hypothetical protein